MANNPIASNSTADKNALMNVFNWLNDNGPNLLNSILDVGLAITSVIVTIPKNELFTTGFIILLFLAFGAILSNFLIWKRERRITSLQKLLDDSSCKLEEKQKIIEGYIMMSSDIINNYLSVLSNDTLSLSDSERISLFKYDGNSFIRMGRYSKNPIFKENGRVSYPAEEGCISFAWQNGECFIDTLPDPQKNLNAWCKEQFKQCKVPKEISKKLTMKSRNILALAIEEPIHKTRIGVLVIESIKINSINQETTKNLLNSTEITKLYDLIDRMKNIVPDLRKAMDKGF